MQEIPGEPAKVPCLETFFLYIPLKIYKTNYLLHYLLITLRNTTRMTIPRGATDYDNPVAINIERNKNYWVNQEKCTTRPQSHKKEPPTDSHNLSRICDASKRLTRIYNEVTRSLETSWHEENFTDSNY